ncbi:hypothetical protein BDB00DRAFT_853826 [Zychaea mexicana]|uniref:uncharacterized protein n=1 Tax=Zychaea mexicana TaxID=64656 RepID=UPI0022FDE315|nr:uncharacterized protein BDB00DRAFT_853826 [Zychaea mexicana]KAI9484729.1 hypothetical protein BDB00DRAFT_853826 [Zychaea mexicana]
MRFPSADSFCARNMAKIGLIFQTTWAIHWHSVLDQTPWNHTIALNHLISLLARYTFLSSSVNVDSTNNIRA